MMNVEKIIAKKMTKSAVMRKFKNEVKKNVKLIHQEYLNCAFKHIPNDLANIILGYARHEKMETWNDYGFTVYGQKHGVWYFFERYSLSQGIDDLCLWTYKRGKKNGRAIYFEFVNNEISTADTYTHKNDKLDGFLITFDSMGKTVRKKYHKGKLVLTKCESLKMAAKERSGTLTLCLVAGTIFIVPWWIILLFILAILSYFLYLIVKLQEDEDSTRL